MIITEELKQSWRNFKSGWDSYKAEVPSELAIKNATDWVNVTKNILEPIRIVADPVGGILLRYGTTRRLYIQFLNNGNNVLLSSDIETDFMETYKYLTIEEIKDFVENNVIPT